jgi:hypothetical protein
MSAARLREAAAWMRERAQALVDNARRYPEETGGPDAWWSPAFIEDAFRAHSPIDPPYSDACEEAWEAAGDHLAAMTPAVALAVADWLEHTAEVAEHYSKAGARFPDRRMEVALAVADAYLGSAS